MNILWSAQAVRDLEAIQDFLEEVSPRASVRMWRRIHERVALQATMPFAAPLYGEGPARALTVSGTPYIVFYVVEDNTLKVEQVLHAAQQR